MSCITKSGSRQIKKKDYEEYELVETSDEEADG